VSAKPTFFETEAAFRGWLETHHETVPELLVGFWKKGAGRPSIDWPQARDQALCFGWIDVNVERYEALCADGRMTAAGVRAYQENKGRQGVYSYENALKELTAAETKLFKANEAAWADWERRPPSYRRAVLHWIASARKDETRARRLATLIGDSAAGRKIAGFDIGRDK
jgi:uncharacterized protein YdeI (YjbR/CyaY-like superfamily)